MCFPRKGIVRSEARLSGIAGPLDGLAAGPRGERGHDLIGRVTRESAPSQSTNRKCPPPKCRLRVVQPVTRVRQGARAEVIDLRPTEAEGLHATGQRGLADPQSTTAPSIWRSIPPRARLPQTPTLVRVGGPLSDGERITRAVGDVREPDTLTSRTTRRRTGSDWFPKPQGSWVTTPARCRRQSAAATALGHPPGGGRCARRIAH